MTVAIVNQSGTVKGNHSASLLKILDELRKIYQFLSMKNLYEPDLYVCDWEESYDLAINVREQRRRYVGDSNSGWLTELSHWSVAKGTAVGWATQLNKVSVGRPFLTGLKKCFSWRKLSGKKQYWLKLYLASVDKWK